jgi:coproporphyrinogen III oxidase-like Fe-S oxidoreductase
VSDHPDIAAIVHDLASSGREVGLSSLRADRINDDLAAAMRRAGYRTLTTALDGASARLRARVDRSGQEQHFLTAAALARRHHMHRLKLYLMLGLPGEADEDIDECVRLVSELSRTLPVALGVAPFCAKRNTPLDGSPYAGTAVVRARLARLKRGLRGRATVRSTSARWAWVEHILAQGGPAEGLAVARAVAQGGRFSDYRRAFAALGHEPDG